MILVCLPCRSSSTSFASSSGFQGRLSSGRRLVRSLSDGGLEQALREAAEHSGVEAAVELPGPATGGQVLLACAPHDVERLGTKGLQRIGTVS